MGLRRTDKVRAVITIHETVMKMKKWKKCAYLSVRFEGADGQMCIFFERVCFEVPFTVSIVIGTIVWCTVGEVDFKGQSEDFLAENRRSDSHYCWRSIFLMNLL